MTKWGLEFTHKGWLWFCPVYLNMADGDDFLVAARWSLLDPLFWLAEKFEELRIFLTSMQNPEWEPQFMFKVTGAI